MKNNKSRKMHKSKKNKISRLKNTPLRSQRLKSLRLRSKYNGGFWKTAKSYFKSKKEPSKEEHVNSYNFLLSDMDYYTRIINQLPVPHNLLLEYILQIKPDIFDLPKNVTSDNAENIIASFDDVKKFIKNVRNTIDCKIKSNELLCKQIDDIYKYLEISSKTTISQEEKVYYNNVFNNLKNRPNLIIDYLGSIQNNSTIIDFPPSVHPPPVNDFLKFITKLNNKLNCSKNILWHDPTCKQLSVLIKNVIKDKNKFNTMFGMNYINHYNNKYVEPNEEMNHEEMNHEDMNHEEMNEETDNASIYNNDYASAIYGIQHGKIGRPDLSILPTDLEIREQAQRKRVTEEAELNNMDNEFDEDNSPIYNKYNPSEYSTRYDEPIGYKPRERTLEEQKQTETLRNATNLRSTRIEQLKKERDQLKKKRDQLAYNSKMNSNMNDIGNEPGFEYNITENPKPKSWSKWFGL